MRGIRLGDGGRECRECLLKLGSIWNAVYNFLACIRATLMRTWKVWSLSGQLFQPDKAFRGGTALHSVELLPEVAMCRSLSTQSDARIQGHSLKTESGTSLQRKLLLSSLNINLWSWFWLQVFTPSFYYLCQKKVLCRVQKEKPGH